MRYSHIFQSPPSPSDAGLIKAKAGPFKLQKTRLPVSRYHSIRKASISTGSSSSRSNSVESPATEARNQVKGAFVPDAILEADDAASERMPKPARLQLKAWESYLHWLCLTEESGTLWSSELCSIFRQCLCVTDSIDETCSPVKAAEFAHRIDDIYWSFYLPLDPLFSFMEDRILSGYLLHVWTMFIELGKRIPYNDPAQDNLVELLKELVHLPPMEVRTWEGNDAPWTDLPTLDDALMAAWDDLYDPEIQMDDPEGPWLNYFAFLGRLVAAEVTPEWFEIPAITLKEVIMEDITPTYLTTYKTKALAEFMNQAGEGFLDWCIESGTLDARKNLEIMAPLMKSPVRQDWFTGKDVEEKEAKKLELRGRQRLII